MVCSGGLGDAFFPFQASDVPLGVEWRNRLIDVTGYLVHLTLAADNRETAGRQRATRKRR